MNNILILIICLCRFCKDCYASHSAIGDYPQISEHPCGLGRETQVMDDSCFEWHKTDNSMAKIMNGREAMPGEVPYVVAVVVLFYAKPDLGNPGNVSDRDITGLSEDGPESYSGSGDGSETGSGEVDQSGYTLIFDSVCTGSLLNANMAITAAHCLDYEGCRGADCIVDIFVVFGKHLMADVVNIVEQDPIPETNHRRTQTYILYPGFDEIRNFTSSDFKKQSLDMAIIYWSDPIEWNNMEVQPICLPQNRAINKDKEYAMISGWGNTDYDNSGPIFLPMGWTIILPPSNDKDDYYGDLVISKIVPYPGGTANCIGDSGGPLIQYVRGRAVLIGTLFGDLKYSSDLSVCALNESAIIAHVRVSNKIDWILEMSQFVKQELNKTKEGEPMDYNAPDFQDQTNSPDSISGDYQNTESSP